MASSKTYLKACHSRNAIQLSKETSQFSFLLSGNCIFFLKLLMSLQTDRLNYFYVIIRTDIDGEIGSLTKLITVYFNAEECSELMSKVYYSFSISHNSKFFVPPHNWWSRKYTRIISRPSKGNTWIIYIYSWLNFDHLFLQSLKPDSTCIC